MLLICTDQKGEVLSVENFATMAEANRKMREEAISEIEIRELAGYFPTYNITFELLSGSSAFVNWDDKDGNYHCQTWTIKSISL